MSKNIELDILSLANMKIESSSDDLYIKNSVSGSSNIRIDVNDNGTNRNALLMVPSGNITFPRMSGASGWKSIARTITNSTNTVIRFDSEIYDTLREYDSATTGEFTCKYAGVYQCNCVFGYEPYHDHYNYLLRIEKNGVTQAQSVMNRRTGTPRNLLTNNIACCIPCAADDVLRFTTYHDYTAPETIQVNEKFPNFSIVKIA